MARDYVTMKIEFIRIQQDAQRLAGRLKEAGRVLRGTGNLDGEIEGELSQLLHDWDTLAHSLFADDVDFSEADSRESHQLKCLAEKLEHLERRERARAVLGCLQQVTFVDGSDSSELHGLHRDARTLEDSLNDAESGPVMARLVEGKHAGNSLLALIRDGDRLSDREWAEHQARVTEAYGASIATAAVRGRLTIRGDAPSRTDQAEKGSSTSRDVKVFSVTRDGELIDDMSITESGGFVRLSIAAEDEVVCDEDESPEESTSSAEMQETISFQDNHPHLTLLNTDISAVIEDEAEKRGVLEEAVDDSIFDAPDDAIPSKGPALIKEASAEWQELRAAVTHEDVDVESPHDDSVTARSDVIDALPKRYCLENGPIQEVARAARTDAVLHRDQHVSEVILHLAADDRMGMAASVARGQEARGETQVPFLPVWLLEALAFSPHVTFVRGRLAAMIESALSHCHERVWHDLSDDWREGLGFFVRAATLRPSVVAPGTRASAILRSFALNGECTELYNYCSRIATFGERLQGLMPALFTQRQSHLSREDHLRVLQAEVRQWCEVLRERTIEYTPAKQLFLHANWSVKAGTSVRHSLHVRRWQKWQQTLRLADRIVRPVREGNSELVPEVKAEVRRLSACLREGAGVDCDSEIDSDAVIHLPLPAMRNVLREAMAYAQRWVSLQSSSEEDADFFLPQAAEELRAEVLDRHDAVVRELECVRDQAQSLVVAAGVTCLLRAVHQLREMVDPSGPVSPTESDPRHLLGAEFLKIPGMQLDERWEPTTDPVEVQNRVLRFLAEPQPDWTTAFQLRCEAGDRVGTERLLELDVWDSTEQRDQLREIRDHYIQPTRASLMAELVQFEQRLQEIAKAESLADDQQELDKRARRLREALGSEGPSSASGSTIEWCRTELSALRNGIRALQLGVSPDISPASPEPEQGLPDDHLLH
ncbi:MAG: hypothetical protein R3B91_21810 [Planctomycetaceae bacterium]